MKHKAALSTLMATALFGFAPALAVGSEWRSGYGQGILEAFIDLAPGNQIYVACMAGALRPSTSISFMLGGNSPPSQSQVTLTFDGEAPFDVGVGDRGVLRSDCHACAANFDYVLERFKAKQTVHVRFEGGLSATFPLAGASAAISDDCVADFWENY